jgi:cytoskeletal protein RodZ
MALSQDEQRMLAEIERRLAADDPGLASCLTTFRRPGPATVLRSPRARIIGSLFTVLLVAMVSLMVYAMIPFRVHVPRHAPATAGAPVGTSLSAASSGQPHRTQSASASTSTSTSTKSTASQAATSTASAASTKTQQAKAKPTLAMVPSDVVPGSAGP